MSSVAIRRSKRAASRIKIKANAAAQVVNLINRRVEALRLVSVLLMAATLTAVLGGIALIFYAGELTAQQRQSEINGLIKVSEGLNAERAKATAEIAKNNAARDDSAKGLNKVFADWKTAEAKAASFTSTQATASAGTLSDAEIARLRQEQAERNAAYRASLAAKADYDTAQRSDESIKLSIDNQNKQLDRRLVEIDAKQKEITEQLSKSGTNAGFDYNSTVIRIVAVFLIMFLVQTFITIFRYTMRLGAYYQARVDALNLMQGADVDIDTLQKMSMILSPETYDFGRTPKTPTEQAVDLAKELIRSQKARVS